jgi:hypothetical protein
MGNSVTFPYHTEFRLKQNCYLFESVQALCNENFVSGLAQEHNEDFLMNKFVMPGHYALSAVSGFFLYL